jgi:uncharacterized protein (UPF0332 family)
MDPKDFYFTAIRLRKHSRSEADLRSSISRAYYAAFLTLELVFERVYGSPVGHKFVRDNLVASEDDEIAQLGDELHGLHTDRRSADYRMASVVTDQHAKDAIKTAGWLFTRINKLTPDIIESDVRARVSS